MPPRLRPIKGLGLTKRNKKKFLAQQMLVCLADHAHNLMVWVTHALAQQRGRFAQYGIFRKNIYVPPIAGKGKCNAKGKMTQLTLNKDDPQADDFQQAIQPLLNGITVNLGKI